MKINRLENKLFFQVFLIIILNYFVTNFIYRILQGEKLLYENISIFCNLYDYLTLPLVLILLFPILLYKLRWRDIFNENIKEIKYFFIFILLVYAWGLLTLDYNLYFNQAYHFDRIILFLLLIFSIYSPISFIYFFLLSLLFFNQVMYPNFGNISFGTYINIKPINETLILFIIFMVIKRVYKEFSIIAFFIALLALHASNYYIPVLGKILISTHGLDWIWINDLSNLLIAKYSHGWLLEYIPLDSMLFIVEWVSFFTIPLQIFTFLMQAFALFVFINKRFSLFLFMLFELSHLGILLLSGILFWKWILLNIGIVYVITKLNDKNSQKIFTYRMTLWMLPFILLGSGVFKAHKLAWYDTPLNNFNKVYVVTDNNERYAIDANLFHLYKFAWYDGLLNSFNCFLDEEIRTAWDTLDQTEIEQLTKISNESNLTLIRSKIHDFEKKYGRNQFDITKQKQIREFFLKYFRAFNAYQKKKIIWNYFTPPRHMYRSLDWDSSLNREFKIKEIEIVFSKNFYSQYYHKLIYLKRETIVIPL